MSDQDMEDYLHLWRLIGHLMGVDPAIGASLASMQQSEAMLESCCLHLVEPDHTSSFIARNVLASVALYSPTKYSVEVCTCTNNLSYPSNSAMLLVLDHLGDCKHVGYVAVC